MKTTADLIIESSDGYLVKYQDETIDVYSYIEELLSTYYLENGNFIDAHCKIESKEKFSFIADLDEDDVIDVIQFRMIIEYKNGIINIYAKNESIQCPTCKGECVTEGYCDACGHYYDDMECDECMGLGYIANNWNDISNGYMLHIPEIVLCKTIDLRQGELF